MFSLRDRCFEMIMRAIERIEQERREYHAEEEKLRMATLSRKQRLEFGDVRKRLRNKIRTWARWALGPLLAFGVMAGAINLAQYSRRGFEALATCVYHFAYCTMVWTPLKSCCTQAIDRHAITRFDRAYLVALPLSTALLDVVASAILGLDDHDSSDAGLNSTVTMNSTVASSQAPDDELKLLIHRALGVASHTSLHLFGLIVLPLLLFRTRSRHVRHLLAATSSAGSVASASGRRIASLVSAAVDQTVEPAVRKGNEKVSEKVSEKCGDPTPASTPSGQYAHQRCTEGRRSTEVRRSSVRQSAVSIPIRVSARVSSLAEQVAEVRRLHALPTDSLGRLSVCEWDADLHATVLMVQAAWRAKLARCIKREALLRRREALLRFDWPIAIAAFTYTLCTCAFDVSDNYLFAHASSDPHTIFFSTWPFLLLMPATLILFRYKGRGTSAGRGTTARGRGTTINKATGTVEWSFPHALFFVSALVPLCQHTARLTIFLFHEFRTRAMQMVRGMHMHNMSSCSCSCEETPKDDAPDLYP